MTEPLCAIGILKKLHHDIKKDQWVNTELQLGASMGLHLAMFHLEKNGFVEVDTNELSTKPLSPLGTFEIEEELKLTHSGFYENHSK